MNADQAAALSYRAAPYRYKGGGSIRISDQGVLIVTLYRHSKTGAWAIPPDLFAAMVARPRGRTFFHFALREADRLDPTRMRTAKETAELIRTQGDWFEKLGFYRVFFDSESNGINLEII